MSRTRLVIEATSDLADEVKGYAIGAASLTDELSITEEVLAPPKPVWEQGDAVVIHPNRDDFRFVLVRQGSDRWACSKEGRDYPHEHSDADVDHYFDNGQATALIAGGKVVTPE